MTQALCVILMQPSYCMFKYFNHKLPVCLLMLVQVFTERMSAEWDLCFKAISDHVFLVLGKERLKKVETISH